MSLTKPWTEAEDAKIWKVMHRKTGKISNDNRKQLKRELAPDRTGASVNSRINVVRVDHDMPHKLNDREVAKIHSMLSFRKSRQKGRKMSRDSSKKVVETVNNTLPSHVASLRAFRDLEIARVGATPENPLVYEIYDTRSETLLAKGPKAGYCFRQQYKQHCNITGCGPGICNETIHTILMEKPICIVFKRGPSGKYELPPALRAPGYRTMGDTSKQKPLRTARSSDTSSQLEARLRTLEGRLSATERELALLKEKVTGKSALLRTPTQMSFHTPPPPPRSTE